MSNVPDGSQLTRHDFPSDFIFGAATSAYQIEGAYAEGRKSHNNWDVFTQQRPGKIADGSNGCRAIDHYNRFKEDVKLMKKLGLDTYRFSISWPRILPGGKLSAGINKEGVKFYNDLIDLLLENEITPFVTIFHLEIPQVLEAEYTGFLDRKIVRHYAEFAEVCFFEFGDRVKHWITLNEPLGYVCNSFIYANFPPCHKSTSNDHNSTSNGQPTQHPAPALPYRSVRGLTDATSVESNPGTEPYLVAHHMLLSHSAAVDIYRTKYQAVQGGVIGMTNNTFWYEAYDNKSEADIADALRALDFSWGWFVAPLVTGAYPEIMQERVGSRLPTFTPEESNLIKGSFDFMGVNYYTANFAENNLEPTPENPTYTSDMGVIFKTTDPDGNPIGEQAGSEWLYIVPKGIYNLLMYNKERYRAYNYDPVVYITENGVDEKNLREPIGISLKDDYRIKFYQDHLAYVKKAMEKGVNVKGFIMWALFDNFEWGEGHTVRFGIYFVDYVNDLIRYPKNSAIWYMNFLNKKQLPTPKREIIEEAIEADNNNSVKRKRNR